MIEKKTKNRIFMINKLQPAIYFELRYIQRKSLLNNKLNNYLYFK